jgi:hypothetical protein
MTHDIVQRCQLALEEADTGGGLSYQEIARIVLAASGIAELTEALQGATDLLVEYVGNQVDASVDEYRALLAKIDGNQPVRHERTPAPSAEPRPLAIVEHGTAGPLYEAPEPGESVYIGQDGALYAVPPKIGGNHG